MAAALNTKWSSPGNPTPFKVADFLPPKPLTPEEQAEQDAKTKAVEAANQRAFAVAMNAFVSTLPKLPKPKCLPSSTKA